VDAIKPQPGQRLVEIGPGLGALTRRLLPLVNRLDVVEVDRGVLAPLQTQCAALGELIIHHADALRFDFTQFASGPHTLRVVGNLPYNISTPLVFHLLDQAHGIVDMHFMLQKEVADRLAARPNSRAYGRLSVMVQFRCQVQTLFSVGPGAFSPRPKVDSTFVRLIPYTTPPVRVRDEQRLKRLVAQAFMRRRKTLRNALRGLLNEAQIRAAGVDPRLRPEVLNLEQFACLSDMIDVDVRK
jgi:16S rRNA (adenine1518-N6/adenine1519-N6)-dimethyltransferase